MGLTGVGKMRESRGVCFDVTNTNGEEETMWSSKVYYPYRGDGGIYKDVRPMFYKGGCKLRLHTKRVDL